MFAVIVVGLVSSYVGMVRCPLLVPVGHVATGIGDAVRCLPWVRQVGVVLILVCGSRQPRAFLFIISCVSSLFHVSSWLTSVDAFKVWRQGVVHQLFSAVLL